MNARELIASAANWWLNLEYEREARRIAPEIEELNLKRVEVNRQGGFEATFVTPAGAMIATEMARMLDAAQAENCIQFELLPRLDRGLKPVRVTVQWASGKPPLQLVSDLKARVAELEARIAELEAHDGADPTGS